MNDEPRRGGECRRYVVVGPAAGISDRGRCCWSRSRSDLGTELAPAATDATTFTVLVNNLAVIGYLAIGVFTAGIGTLAVLALNGAVFGYAITAAIAGGYGSAILSGVVPHMFPELAGFLVAAVADMRLGLLVARRTLSRTDLDVAASGRRWIVAQVAAVALIIVGAIIEGEVSYV